MKSVLLAGVIALCVGCAGCGGGFSLQSELPVPIAAVHPDDFAVIEAYNEVFDAAIFVADPEGVPIEIVDEIEGHEDLLGYTDQHTIQMAVAGHGTVYRAILAHELGHVLGCGHITGTIMEADTPMGDLEEMIAAPAFSGWVIDSYGL